MSHIVCLNQGVIKHLDAPLWFVKLGCRNTNWLDLTGKNTNKYRYESTSSIQRGCWINTNFRLQWVYNVVRMIISVGHNNRYIFKRERGGYRQNTSSVFVWLSGGTRGGGYKSRGEAWSVFVCSWQMGEAEREKRWGTAWFSADGGCGSRRAGGYIYI